MTESISYDEYPLEPDEGLVSLFRDVFRTSEGAAEGEVIGTLVQALLRDTAAPNIRVFVAHQNHCLVGACIYTRLRYRCDPRQVFILGPMAVATDKQKQGIGQSLIKASLSSLKGSRVDLVMTYGDPSFYGKTGFRKVSLKDAPAPYPLQYPEGWLVNSLEARSFYALPGPVACVSALDKPIYW